MTTDNPGYQCVDEEVARIIRQQAERDAAYWDVGIAAIHVYYTGNGEANAAQLAGWRILQYGRKAIADGVALIQIGEAE